MPRRLKKDKEYNPALDTFEGKDAFIAKTKKGVSNSYRQPRVEKPLLDWLRAEDNSAVRVAFSDDVNSTNIAKALEEIFKVIECYQKVPNVQFEVDIPFSEEDWALVYPKLRSSSNLLAKIDELNFLDSDLSFVHLRDLYDLYCSFENKDSFPWILVETELAKWRFKGLRDLLPKQEESARSFRKKLRVLKAMTALEYLNLGPDMLPFDPMESKPL